MNIVTALMVFGATALADVCWARYTAHAASGRRLPAAFWSMGIYGSGAFAVLQYTNNHWYVAVAALGCFAGTIVGVKPK